MGAIPEWYGLLRAAQYLGVAPWDLAERPIFWQDAALIAMQGEAWAQEQAAKR